MQNPYLNMQKWKINYFSKEMPTHIYEKKIQNLFSNKIITKRWLKKKHLFPTTKMVVKPRRKNICTRAVPHLVLCNDQTTTHRASSGWLPLSPTLHLTFHWTRNLDKVSRCEDRVKLKMNNDWIVALSYQRPTCMPHLSFGIVLWALQFQKVGDWERYWQLPSLNNKSFSFPSIWILNKKGAPLTPYS